uniref:Uncharacterized protein n=1 Tax=Fagus sylvatica TaxID=28930 RepID=A0A2N9FZJ4_FAGSY
MSNTSSCREMVYVEHSQGVNGLPKVILREVRGCSAEVHSNVTTYTHTL